MTDLPSGIVTFLFTDIEGSTRVWERHPEAMALALARHDAIVRGAIVDHGGVVFRTGGDAFCAAFASAGAALAAALAAQRALHAASWDGTGPLRVRMALHTDRVELRDGDYQGPPLNRVARLLAAGHGGQILLSRATEEQVRGRLPPGAALGELGEHRLRDLTEPERIFQLLAPDLPRDFPALKTHDTSPSVSQAAPEPQEAPGYAWRQAKLPDLPPIDFDAVRERERERERERRARRRKPKKLGDMF